MMRSSPRSAVIAPAQTKTARRVPASRSWRLSPERFTLLLVLVCLLLQRFAFPIAGLPVSVATPIGYLLILWGLISGSLGLDRRRTSLMLGLCAIGCVAYGFQLNMPLAIAPRISLASLIYWLAVTSFAVLTFREKLSEAAFFRVINNCLMVVAVAGILEFLGQYVGVDLFSFSGFFPENWLVEYLFNVATPMANGTFRSNGFFLVEPSVFSQYMAVAIIVEGLYFRRPVWLLIFFTGLIVSVSGTGWLVLGGFVLQAALTRGRWGILIAIGVSSVAALVLFLAHLAMPEIIDTLLGRQVEFSMQGTSGNERFVTPFMVLQAVLEDSPRTILTGIGPGAAEHVSVAFKYVLNTPIKILLEYGIFGLVLYIALLVTGERTRRQSAMLVPLMVLLLFTGGNQQFSPILFSILLIMSVARLRDEGFS